MDTVVYKLHKISKYPLIEFAIQNLKKNGKGKILVAKDTSSFGLDTHTEAVLNLKLGKMTFINYNENLKLPSSASGINIMIDNERDFIRFEFSIPKFLFANNVCEIIPPFQSKYYNISDTSMVGLCAEYWYRFLKTMFRKVINELTNCRADFSWCDVELARLDISFNQIFRTKDEAEFYYQCVRKVSLPKNSEFSKKDYVTSIAIENARYYWKIYLKGAEFEKNGQAQIREYFKEYERSGFKNRKDSLYLSMKHIDELQSYADRILRYELEVRPGYMSYLFNQYLKKRRIPEYRQLHKILTYLIREDNLNIAKWYQAKYKAKPGNIDSKIPVSFIDVTFYLPARILDKSSTSEVYKEVFDKKIINRLKKIETAKNILKKKYNIQDLYEAKKITKVLETEYSRNHLFFFDIDEKNAEKAIGGIAISNDGIDRMTILEETPQHQKFSISLLKFIIMKHNQFFKMFQFKKLPDIERIALQVKDHNDTVGTKFSLVSEKKQQKINGNNVKMIMELLKQSTWEEIIKSGRVHRTTVYRWKKKIEKITGVDQVSNFIEDDFVLNIKQDLNRLYSRHYDCMVDCTSPLARFLNSTEILMTV